MWLKNELERKNLIIIAYLDEDESRIGKSINSIELAHPGDFNLPKTGIVLIPLAPILTTQILNKYPKLKNNTLVHS
jgi:hypothetical protein